MTDLQNKVAIVTGAASGMGKATAELLATKGAKVVIADYNEAGAKELSDTLNDKRLETIAYKVDVSKKAEVEAMIEKAVEVYGQLDILVNNAGIMDGFEPIGEITDEKWERVFGVNVNGVMYAMRKAVNYWLDNDREGNIINVISTGGLNGAHAGATYGASKHAVVALTKNTAFMYEHKNIRVNGIAPGAVETNISSSMTGVSEFGASRTKLTQSLIPKVGQAQDIANTIKFLASKESSFINGEIITVDGGWTSAF